MPVEPVPTPSAPPVAGNYSPAVRAGDWLVLAGQVGLDPGSGAIVSGVENQARQVLANIKAILTDCGAAMTDVAKTTIFVTDIAAFGTVNAVYAEAFGDHRPARSTVQVAALPGGAEVEIETWAYVAGQGSPVPGAILLILFLAVIGPIGLFLVGAIWSGISGWVLSDDADNPPADRAKDQASS